MPRMNDPYKKYVTPHEKHLQIIYLREVDTHSNTSFWGMERLRKIEGCGK